MYKYRSIIENPEKLRSMTGLTADEFHALVPIFHTAFEAYMKRRTIDGHVRYCRRYVSYANSPLPTTEDKVLFILTYLKQNPTQVMHGHLFQMSQSNVSKWVHLLYGALNDALARQNLLPVRTANELVRRLHEEPSHEEPSHATKVPPFLSITAYNVPFIVHATNPTDSCIIATDSNVIRSKTRFLSMILVLFTF